MRWRFDGFGKWDACSRFSDEGVSLVYRIHVCEDGSFATSKSDSALIVGYCTFPTLDAAKAFCDGNERDIEASQLSGISG